MVKLSVSKNIKLKNRTWTFGNKIANKFQTHVENSVPFYKEGHNLILELSDYFINDGSIVYDLGCSTGFLSKNLSIRNSDKKFKIYGIDSEKEMIEFAKLNNKTKNITFQNKDLVKLSLKKNDLIVCYYTIQFIKPKYRQKIFDKIFKSLNWGGALIIFEKVRANDARFQDILTGVYNSYKEDKGFSPEEIYNKTKSLKSILEPFSSNPNIELMKRAGFKDILSIQKYICFEGWIAIK